MTADPIAPHHADHQRPAARPSSQRHLDPENAASLQMLKGGVIMDVVTADQAKIAEDAGAVAVMALERVPADIRRATAAWRV